MAAVLTSEERDLALALSAPLLVAHVARWSGRPRRWGRFDCTMFVGEWVATVTGADPAAEWRGRYATEAQAEAILSGLGGMTAAYGVRLAAIGAAPTDAPALGDVGVITPAIGPTGAIRGSRGWWCFAGGRCIEHAGAPVLAAWRLPCRSSLL